MLKDKVIDRLAEAAEPICADRSRCLRMRFNRSECSQCTGVCRSNAIRVQDDVSIDFRLCSKCMLCVSACPSDCFDIKGFDFLSVLAKVKKIRDSGVVPVLGCNMKPSVQAHVTTPCLGFLSLEHLLALSVIPEATVHINMTECGDCKNDFIADKVRETAGSLKVVIIKEKKDLGYLDIPYGRREFFSAVKNLAFLQAAEIFESNDPDMTSKAYSAKKVPLKRDLLNRVFVFLNGKGNDLLKGCYYTIKLSRGCNNCFACVGMCPGGALQIGRADDNSDSYLSFNSSLCNGCGLCRDFCFKDAVHIEKGFAGPNPFEFVPLSPCPLSPDP
ncbi:MAG: 4Fe-4S binding protein [Nitrospirae bacterium]|nr:4Fe-4S binding protein [Nitrospirota bacterium]